MNSFKALTIMAATSAFVGMAVADDVAVTQEDAGETAVVSNEDVLYKFFYDIEGEKKEQMYRDLEKMREERHKENETA